MNQQTIDQIPEKYLELVKAIESRAQYLAKYMIGSEISIVRFGKDRLDGKGEDWIIEFNNAYRGTYHACAFIIGQHKTEHLDRMIENSCQKILLHRSKTAQTECNIKIVKP